MQWVEEDASDEAPGWYFGTVNSFTEEGHFLIVYADNATEVWCTVEPVLLGFLGRLIEIYLI